MISREEDCDTVMGPQGRLQAHHRLSMVQAELLDMPGTLHHKVPQDLHHKMHHGNSAGCSTTGHSGSVSGSPGRLQPDNVSRDSGIGCVKDGSGLNTSGEAENDIPKYITDNNDKSSYVRGKFLGKGGFARVHELMDLNSSAVFAGKIIHKSRVSKPHHKEKISREIELHRSLRHRNVVQFFKHFEDGDNIYIILENCSRKSLVHLLKARHTVTEPETRFFLSQLVDGVSYIHGQNIIHRDLKLGNLFLTANMNVKIGDFGLATRLGQEKKGTICGTPNYISPEVLNKEGHGFPADVWALGCVMYALLVGQPPFETSTLKETYSRIADNHYAVPDTVSRPATLLIRRLLHPSPKSRPSVTSITQDPYFSSGLHPTSLPTSCCSHAPNFPTTTISSLTSSVLSLTLPDQQQQYRSTPHLACPEPNITSSPQQNSSKKARVKSRTGALHEAMTSALASMPGLGLGQPTPASSRDCPIFITKWIDYSNKYGFGFQLSDKSVGVFFNDNTRISYSSDRGYIQFGEGNSVASMAIAQVPPSLHEKFTLLRYFAQYMDENLTEGGEGGRLPGKALVGVKHAASCTIPQIKRWIRTPKAIIMHLTNGTIQVNYFKDHTKLIVGSVEGRISSGFVVTYINSERQSRSWQLSELARRGTSAPVRERMQYVNSVLEEFAELEEQNINIK